MSLTHVETLALFFGEQKQGGRCTGYGKACPVLHSRYRLGPHRLCRHCAERFVIEALANELSAIYSCIADESFDEASAQAVLSVVGESPFLKGPALPNEEVPE